MTNDYIWDRFLSTIQKEVSPITFNCIIKQLFLHSYKNSIVIISTSANNELLLEKVKQNYSGLIENIINDITQDTCEIKYILESDLDNINIDNNTNDNVEQNDSLIDTVFLQRAECTAQISDDLLTCLDADLGAFHFSGIFGHVVLQYDLDLIFDHFCRNDYRIIL